MITKDIKDMIENNSLSLATNMKGNPYVIVVGDVKVISKEEILIGDNYMKNTIDNIKNNNNVCLVVHNNKEGYQIKGNAHYYNSGKWLDKIKEIHKGYPAKGAIIVKINEIKKLA